MSGKWPGPMPSATPAWPRKARSRPPARILFPPVRISAWFITALFRTIITCAANLRREGIDFETDNDSEVAAGYLTSRLNRGDTLKGALERALDDLDGFFTFAVGTRDGFAVLRDRVACKPAVMAETDDYVAMSSEYRSLVSLPGIEQARLWEPEPANRLQLEPRPCIVKSAPSISPRPSCER